jgi:glycosyltransferase involved in cell wall biosynthesis
MTIVHHVFEQRRPGDDQRTCYFLNAYAVSVIGGSEPGMGFAWFSHLLQHHRVVLFTEAEFAAGLMDWVRKQDNASCTIHFFDVGLQTRARCWNQGDWRFYGAYWAYQRAVLRVASASLRTEKPVALHQLNMIGFREPGYFWRLARTSGVPLIWGPVGGYNFPSGSFYQAYGATARWKQSLKNLLNLASMLLPSVVGSYLTASALLLAIPPRGRVMPAVLRRGHLFPETFLRADAASLASQARDNPLQTVTANARADGTLRLAMLGKLVPRKLVDVAIDALSALANAERVRLRVDVIGDGPARGLLEALARQRGVADQIHFCGALPHAQALARVRSADMLLHCSVDEGTSHAVVEALALEMPVMAFDCGGHAVIARSAGLALLPAPRHRAQAVSTIAQALRDTLSSPSTHLIRPAMERLALWTGTARIAELHRLMRWAGAPAPVGAAAPQVHASLNPTSTNPVNSP